VYVIEFIALLIEFKSVILYHVSLGVSLMFVAKTIRTFSEKSLQNLILKCGKLKYEILVEVNRQIT
jgi:hypothetical protein